MSVLNSQERISKILMLERNLNRLSNESLVRRPCPSIKTIFNGNKPKNRRNLKKLGIQKSNNNKTYNKPIKKPKYKTPSIQSIINNSINNEFLSLDHPNNNYNYNKPIIIPMNNFSNGNSSSTLYSINKRNNVISNNLKKSIDVISNHSKNNKLQNSINDNVMKSKKISKMSDGTNYKKPVNLNDLYNEFIANVSKILFKIFYI
jgi:hypothetical protein